MENEMLNRYRPSHRPCPLSLSLKVLGLVAAAALTASASPALAQTAPDGVSMGTPAYGGSGCPAGSAAATLSPDGQSLSILFDQYSVEAGGMSGKNVDRKSCNIAIPVNVPAGYSVSVFKIDYRGFNSLPYGASSQFNVEYFFAGSQGPMFQKAFSGPINDDFLISNQVVAQAVSWSPCGESVNLRANTSLMAQTNSSYQQAMASVDSADVNSAVVFALQWRTCGSGPNPQPTYPPYPNPNPTYPPNPVPTPIPTPIPPYPGPGPVPFPPNATSCTIDQTYDAYGRTVFNVRDVYGRVLTQTYDYSSALRTAQTLDRNGSCRGNVNPYPNPVPPTPYPPYPGPVNSCSVAQGRNAYGQTLYRVMHRSGAVVYTTTSYNDAVRVQQTNPSCFR